MKKTRMMRGVMRGLALLGISLGLGLALSGCNYNNYGLPYKPATQQGNWITQDQVNQLKKGFSKEQVLYLLGTPLNTNLYGQAQWFYLYLYQVPYELPVQRFFVLSFKPDGTLSSWCGSAEPNVQPYTPQEAAEVIQGQSISCAAPAGSAVNAAPKRSGH